MARYTLGWPMKNIYEHIPGCPDTQVSYRNAAAVPKCYFNHPGRQLLLTQFWDTNPSTGPVDTWTMHGLWPNNCDGTWRQYYDTPRKYTSKDYQGNDDTFWKQVWDKHGTCINTLSTECYSGYPSKEEMTDYSQTPADLSKTYKVRVKLISRFFKWIFEATDITPSSTKTYTSAAIQNALATAHSFRVTIRCKNSELDGIWYHYNVKGSLQTGEFIPASLVCLHI
ncbi:ribonuclease T2-like protein [Tuber brumale]|nr:ribonuclease T2-like protein [Tuber brumale]